MKNWLVKIVQGKYRCWDDFRIYGIVSAGHDSPPSGSLKRIKEGDRIFAYFGSKGIIAVGIVGKEAVLAGNCVLEGNFIAKDGSGSFSKLHIKDIMLHRPFMLKDAHDPIKGEWIVKINWLSIAKKPKNINNLSEFENAATELLDHNIIKEIEDRFDQSSV